MKLVFLTLGLVLFSANAMANEYECQSKNQRLHAYLIFDDGPGGLDYTHVTLNDQEYKDFADEEGSVLKITDRDTFKNTYEYAGDDIEIGFTAEDGLSLDIIAKRVKDTQFKGKVFVKSGSKKTVWSLTCTEI